LPDERPVASVGSDRIKAGFDAEVDETSGAVLAGLFERPKRPVDIAKPYVHQARLVRRHVTRTSQLLELMESCQRLVPIPGNRPGVSQPGDENGFWT
jgi:hypothetical protein